MENNMSECCCSKDGPSEEVLLSQFDELLTDYKDKPGALIPVLQIAQKMFGYLPDAVLKKVSLFFEIPYSEVAGVVTFYSFFSTVPKGKYIVRVCLGTACYVRGGKAVLESFKNELGIDIGETTEDRLFSLEIGRCFGACGLAPVIMINDDVHQRVKPAKVFEILQLYKANEDGGNNDK